VERPQAPARGSGPAPRTNDIDTDERRQTIPQRGRTTTNRPQGGRTNGVSCRDPPDLRLAVFVVDGAEHLVGRVPADRVVLVDPPGDRPTGLLPGGEVVAAQQLELDGGVERFRGRVVQRRTGAAHRLGHAGVPARLGEQFTGVFTALVGVEQQPGRPIRQQVRAAPAVVPGV